MLSRLFPRRAAKRRPFRLRLEALEARWQPAVIDWTGAVSGNWDVGGNWAGGVVPGGNDTAHFGAGAPNCYVPSGSYETVGGLNLDAAWAGTLTLDHTGPLPSLDATLDVGGTANLDGGYVYQQGANCELTLLGGGTWDGTVLNYGTGTTKATVTFAGSAWTVKTGAQFIGSDMQIGYGTNATTMTWLATTNTVDFGNHANLTVGGASTLSLNDPGAGGGSYDVDSDASDSIVVVDGTLIRWDVGNQFNFYQRLRAQLGGTVWVKDSSSLGFDGNDLTNDYSVTAYQGSTVKLGDGAKLYGRSGFYSAGTVTTTGSSATILGLISVQGMDCYLDTDCQVSIRPGGADAWLTLDFNNVYVYGTLNIKINVDPGSRTASADLLICSKNVTLETGSSLSVTTTGTPVRGTTSDEAIVSPGAGLTVAGNFSNFAWNGGYEWNHTVKADGKYYLTA